MTARPARRRAPRHLALTVVGLAVSAVALSGCGTSTGVTITLYNGQHVQTTDALVAAFEKAHPGIRVAIRSNDENTLDNEIVQEGARTPADVMYAENSPPLEYLQSRGLLERLPDAILRRAPAVDSSPDGTWVGVSTRVSVMVYNPSLIKKSHLPTSVLQLAQPRFRGLVGLAPSETDFQPIITAVLQREGRATTVSWLEGLKSNAGGHIYASNEALTLAVNRGAVAVGVINQYYWYRLAGAIGSSSVHSTTAFFAAHDPGYVIDISGAAVLRSSRHRGAAQAFVRFLDSRTAQLIIARSQSYEYPVVSGVAPNHRLTPFSSLAPDPLSVRQLGTGQRAVALLREVQLL